jgi:hypothetical protein
MYFWGIHFQPKKEGVILALLQKSQKQLQKKYKIVALFPMAYLSGTQALAEAITKLYKDRKWSVRKRLYSQDGRPTRSILTYPTVVVCGVHEDANPLALTLRNTAVPIQTVFIVPNGSWRRVEYGRALGHDYYVSMAELVERAGHVFSQNRLRVGDIPNKTAAIDHPCSLANAVEAYLDAADASKELALADVLPAVAAPLWFRETIPYRRAYCSR